MPQVQVTRYVEHLIVDFARIEDSIDKICQEIARKTLLDIRNA